ncbi:DNA-3-methyladenine glycosylase family protein [Siphonobacter sp.]|uniref:DNA-3-methyladenine glycosylase family protein n=1 Tax=Siphonobacter sp. TaxID=1869184 RepID=UPI003B3B5B6F
MQEALVHLVHRDAKLAKVLAAVTLPAPEPTGDLYYDLLDSIVSQQLSTKAAAVIFQRFLTLFPGEYPHPQQLLALDIETLRSVGLSKSKAHYMQNVAEFWLKEKLENKNWDEYDDDALVDYLSQIKGVGRWTVEMILIFTLQRPDVFPVDDLGVQQGMMLVYGLEKDRNLRKRMIEIAEHWRPYRTTASRAMWRWKNQQKNSN